MTEREKNVLEEVLSIKPHRHDDDGAVCILLGPAVVTAAEWDQITSQSRDAEPAEEKEQEDD